MLPAARCRTCGAAIFWVDTETGKKMPVDAEPVDHGNIIFLEKAAHVLKADETPPEGARRYTSHFATCKDAKFHRRVVARMKVRRA